MLMEMRIFKEKRTGAEVIELMHLNNFSRIKIKEKSDSAIITLEEPDNIDLFNKLYNRAVSKGITAFTRKRFYASFSKIITQDMVDDIENQEELYYTEKDIGHYTHFSGQQVNTFEEAWEQLQIYADCSGRPIEDYKVELRVITDDSAREI